VLENFSPRKCKGISNFGKIFFGFPPPLVWGISMGVDGDAHIPCAWGGNHVLI